MSRFWKISLGLVLFAACLAGGAWIDTPLARWLDPEPIPGDLMRTIRFMEIYAHGFGVLLILLTVYTLDERGWRPLPRLLSMSFLPGLAVNMVKLTLARYRPNEYRYVQKPYSFEETFVGWFPTFNLPEEIATDHTIQSFPSAHTAMAVGLAMGLSIVYPKGRKLFLFFAVLSGMQRLTDHAHFLTDVIVGAGIGFCVSKLLTRESGWLERTWRKWESGPETASEAVTIPESTDEMTDRRAA
ncbi:MAG: phosphatase PAP2 family protein [Planctomycetaceae bacterium]|nr:phosphatase PAP2 family protein [Planctomycetaceae bacterium]